MTEEQLNQEWPIEKKIKELRANLNKIIIPHVSVLIYVLIISFMLNWVYSTYGFEKAILSGFILIATMLYRR